jgi:hypothetical protein
MSDTELLPCAHCGGEADFAETNKKHVVECQSCVLSTSVPTHSKETAALYWNKRAPITLDQAKQVMSEAGMVAVPVEPTEEMIEGFWGEITHGDEERACAVEAYKAMTKAAQEKPDA